MNQFKSRTAVYTCITGGYDRLKTPSVVSPDVDYYCFTDRQAAVQPPWKFMPIGMRLGKKGANRYIKMHPHLVLPEYEFSIYVDGSIQIVGDMEDLRAKLPPSGGDVFLYDHPLRDCVYEEAAACCHYSHEWFWTVSRQLRRYAKEGLVQHDGLFEGGVIARRHTPRMAEAMSLWWREYTNGAKRDQLSLPYVAHRYGDVLTSMGRSDHRFTHNYFLFVRHPKSGPRPVAIFRKYVNRSAAALLGYERLLGVKGIKFRHVDMPEGDQKKNSPGID